MLLISLIVVCAAAASAGPVHKSEPTRTMSLSEAQSRKSICPIVVEKDVDETRIPQRIKVIRCKEGGAPASAASAPARHHHGHCAAMTKDDQLWQCVELYDSVLVYFRHTAEVKKIDVPVGCSCVQWTPQVGRNAEDRAPQ